MTVAHKGLQFPSADFISLSRIPLIPQASIWKFMTTTTNLHFLSRLPRRTWSAVGSLSMCVAMLIAAEFMPVSLLTPIAEILGHRRDGGQAISFQDCSPSLPAC